jgi:hypothetical protein
LFWKFYLRPEGRTRVELELDAETSKKGSLASKKDIVEVEDKGTTSRGSAEGRDRTFGCQLHMLQQPLRSVVVQGGLNGLTKYSIFLHKPLTDKHISESLWISKGSSFLEDDYQELFYNAIEIVQQVEGREKVTIMDLGANIGLHALFFAKVGGEPILTLEL